MSTRILRDERGYARKGPTQVIRTRPHACGRNCPLHDESVQAVMRQAWAAQAARHG